MSNYAAGDCAVQFTPLNFSITDAAKRLGVSRITIYRLSRRGLLPIYKMGSRSLIRSEDIDALQERLIQGDLASDAMKR